MKRPCIKCGTPNEGTDYCPECRPKRTYKPKPSATKRGYGYAWEKLSKRARQLQPFCVDCMEPGTPDNPLGVDHSPAAWERVKDGKPLTLRDFENGLLAVVCNRCNIRRGNARGHSSTRT